MGRRRDHQRNGYTLAEMLIASVSASVLMGGLASTIYVAGQALDLDGGASARDSRNSRAVDLLLADVGEALAFTELSSTAVAFRVPDRTGDGVPDTIRYAWSGVSGESLTYEFNGEAPLDVIADVRSLDFASVTRLLRASGVAADESGLPLLFVVEDDKSLTSDESARESWFRGWGYEVTPLSDDSNQGDYDDALAEASVVYVSGEVDASRLADKLNGTTLGVVTESLDHAINLGLATGGATVSSSEIEVVLDTHYIATGFANGPLAVLSGSQFLKRFEASGTGRDSTAVASLDDGTLVPSLLFVDAADEVATSPVSWAAGRRCVLPWGDSGFDPASLNASGQTLTKRALEWATGRGPDTENPGVHFRGFAEAKRSSNRSDLTIDLPEGVVTGDLLIAAVAVDGDRAGGLRSPSDWREVRVRGDDNARVTLGVWWKQATSSESSSHRFTWSGSEEAYGWIMRFDGHDPVAPIHDWDDRVGSGSSSPPCDAVTTTVADAMILRLGGFDDDDVTVDESGMAGHATITMDESDNGSGTVSGGAAYAIQPTAGVSTVESFSLTRQEGYVTLTIAIAPETDP